MNYVQVFSGSFFVIYNTKISRNLMHENFVFVYVLPCTGAKL